MTRRRTMAEAVRKEMSDQIVDENRNYREWTDAAEQTRDAALKNVERKAIAALAKVGVHATSLNLKLDTGDNWTRSQYITVKPSADRSLKEYVETRAKLRRLHEKKIADIRDPAQSLINEIELCDKITPEIAAKVRAYCGVKE